VGHPINDVEDQTPRSGVSVPERAIKSIIDREKYIYHGSVSFDFTFHTADIGKRHGRSNPVIKPRF
jgi:hypothetical protein